MTQDSLAVVLQESDRVPELLDVSQGVARTGAHLEHDGGYRRVVSKIPQPPEQSHMFAITRSILDANAHRDQRNIDPGLLPVALQRHFGEYVGIGAVAALSAEAVAKHASGGKL